jgi:tetratricopeptide (TPR) repeat protein
MTDNIMENKKETHLEEILEKVKEGKVVLFLGAGASFDADGPGADTLLEMIKQKFPKIEAGLNNLLDACQDVVDTLPYDEQQLEDFVVSILDSLKPTKSHFEVARYDWSAIFTTNYDNLIEVGYQLAPQRLKPCYSIRQADFSVNLTDRSKVYLFKIMGCISQRGQRDGSPILTRSDYNSALERRAKYLSYLFDFLKNGTVVFVGYSGRDRLVFEVFDELAEKYGLDRLPYSYILLPRELSEKEQFLFSRRKMIHVPCSFGEFMDYLGKKYEAPLPTTLVISPVRLNLAGQILEFKDLNPRVYREYFALLDEETLREDQGEKDAFFRGINLSFGAFASDWDFKREIYSGDAYGKPHQRCLKSKVFEELKKTSPDDNRVIIITGMGGVGKSFMLRRLAYDVYRSGAAPVVMMDPNRFAFDFKLLDSVLQRISQQFTEITKTDQPTKALILIDDAPSQVFDPIKLKNYLASRSRLATIVIAGRENEFLADYDNTLSKVQKDDIFGINENLNAAEKEKIAEHLLNLGYITPLQTWDLIIDKRVEDSFFATMYALVHPSQKPLNEIIQDQYLKLKGLAKEMFEYICCLHQFNLPINEELLVRALGCSYAHFFETIESETKGLVYTREDSTGTRLYSAHHRIIARKTVEFFFGDAEVQKQMFLKILSDLHFSNIKERELVEKLMISFLGPHGKGTDLTNFQKREIFQLVCDQGPPRSIVHHWGLLELEDNKFENAENLLKKALALPRRFEESFRGESDQNILTSLGTLYSRKGLTHLKNKELKQAEENFSKAQSCFVNAKLGGFPNAYAYHAHAYMFFKRGQETSQMEEKIGDYAEALKILELARDNLNTEDLQPIIELQTLVYDSLGRSSEVWENIRILAEKYGNSKGYYLYANWLRHKAYRKEGEEQLSILKEALKIVQDGLDVFAEEESLLMLQAKIMKILAKLPDFYNALTDWYSCTLKTATAPSIWLLSELAAASFELGFYDNSKKYFALLDELSSGNRLKFKLQRFVKDEAGALKRFEGKIISIIGPREGEVSVESLPNLRYHIRFRPHLCYWSPSEVELVKFNIAFDYVSPVAVNLEKL